MENLTSTVAFWLIKHEPDIAECWLRRQQLRINVLIMMNPKPRSTDQKWQRGGCYLDNRDRNRMENLTSTVAFWLIKHEPDVAE